MEGILEVLGIPFCVTWMDPVWVSVLVRPGPRTLHILDGGGAQFVPMATRSSGSSAEIIQIDTVAYMCVCRNYINRPV